MTAQKIAEEKKTVVTVKYRGSSTDVRPGMSKFTEADINFMFNEAKSKIGSKEVV